MSALPADVRDKFENLPTEVNYFHMMGYSPGTFIEIKDMTGVAEQLHLAG